MILFQGDTADQVWKQAADLLSNSDQAALKHGRGGDTKEVLHACFSISNPRERWVLNRQPAINPAFAIAEVIWIMTGRNDAKFLRFFNSKLHKYVGEDDSCYGAYGFRLRNHFEHDQLDQAYHALKSNPNSRQVVLQIWDINNDMPNLDGSARGCDVPCNVLSMLKVDNGRLEWTQIMRSNDIFRGTPYNFIQFTSLQEIMAGWLGLEVGSYNHLSDSLHMYMRDERHIKSLSSIELEPNTDVLSSPKSTSEENFRLLGEHVNMLISPSTKLDDADSLIKDSGLLPAYRNLFCVLVAEVARKNGWDILTNTVMDQCTNRALRQGWHQWVSRVKVK